MVSISAVALESTYSVGTASSGSARVRETFVNVFLAEIAFVAGVADALSLLVEVDHALSVVAFNNRTGIVKNVTEGSGISRIARTSVFAVIGQVDHAVAFHTVVVEAACDFVFVDFTIMAGVISFTLALVSVKFVSTATTVLARIHWEACVVFVDLLIYPREKVVNVGVDTGVTCLGTANTE